MLALILLLQFCLSQGAGTPETHLKITWQKCTASGCTNQNGGIVIDSEWREIVDAQGRSCVDGNQWDESICPDATTCSKACNLNGFDYTTVGVSTSGSAVKLSFVTPRGDVGSRVYLYDEDAGTYVNFKMLNKEFTFDVDTSTVACAINGALYFSEMDPDGGKKRFSANTAGAEYGTGYCDAQCPRDGKFIGNYANLGRKYGSCCFEWDVWEANAYGSQMAAHPCKLDGPAYVCESDCSKCDTNGCAWNPYYKGETDYYGPGLKVDTKKKFTVITQFITDNGKDDGKLKEVRRKYVSGGKVIENNIRDEYNGVFDSITDKTCTDAVYDSGYTEYGGDAAWSTSFKRGAVLAMSIWTDGSMWWLDSGEKGPCSESSGGTEGLVKANPNAYVEYSNIRYGDIDSTY